MALIESRLNWIDNHEEFDWLKYVIENVKGSIQSAYRSVEYVKYPKTIRTFSWAQILYQITGEGIEKSRGGGYQRK